MFRLFLALVLLTEPFAHQAALGWSGVYEARAFAAGTRFVKEAAVLTSGFDSSYKLSLPHPVQDKNFYLLSLFQRNPDVRRLLTRNRLLSRLASQKHRAISSARSCDDVACFDELLRFSDGEVEAVARTLRTLAAAPAFQRLAKRHLRPSGVFIKHANLPDSQMFVAAWKDAANGMNRILRVYGLGKNPFYKDIDRVSFDVSSDEYRDLVKTRIAEIRLNKDSLFFEPTLNFALKLLEANRRDEAGRYEPLEEGENKFALQSMKQIKWSDYPYSFILVLGSGPQDSARLSPGGARRADQAARLFFELKAPLVILSGGHVHPMQTPYCEAIEMKKHLMEKHKIPEASILIEPHARHTTTNFRNAARLVFRYGIPTDRKGLVTSSEAHIGLVTENGFRIRCTTELGYFPMESIKRVSPIAAEFTPSVSSLFFDANDPLDP